MENNNMNSGAETIHEHELRAFLTESEHDLAAHQLAEIGDDLGQDDKKSYFFVLNDLNLSVARTVHDARIKLKGGVVGKDSNPVEFPELILDNPESTVNAVQILSVLTGVNPQESYQVRHNYRVGLIEVALKYTEAWGFHAEFERLYSGGTEEEIEVSAQEADKDIHRLAGRIGIKLATNDEIQLFRNQFDRTGKGRGQYSLSEFMSLYSSLAKLAALRRLPNHQVLDKISIDWIEQHRPENLPSNGENIQLSKIEMEVIENLDLPKTWFVSAERKYTIHGQLHLARVAVLSSHLARADKSNDVESRSCFIAGLLHDIRRIDDKSDPGHAKASADWTIKNWDIISDFLGPITEGIKPTDIYHAILMHDGQSDITDSRYQRLSKFLRTADALDRYRLPKLNWWIDDSRVNIVPDPSLKASAFDAVIRSENELIKTGDILGASRVIVDKTSKRHK